ncbi:hypothetical protein [Streptosporangium sp. CA-115845]|uniref:hypothetical protein n=1 Tax=Streptosporangium sp. CA-115845 TaxID=3240071 RepID=UPI003D8B5FBA
MPPQSKAAATASDVHIQALAKCLTTIGQALITYGQALAGSPPAADQTIPGDRVGPPLPGILRCALDAFAAVDDSRLHSADLAATLDMTPVELAAALRPYSVVPLPRPFERGGTRARGYSRQDVENAAAAWRTRDQATS